MDSSSRHDEAPSINEEAFSSTIYAYAQPCMRCLPHQLAPNVHIDMQLPLYTAGQTVTNRCHPVLTLLLPTCMGTALIPCNGTLRAGPRA
jgi:hypothetical protein